MTDYPDTAPVQPQPAVGALVGIAFLIARYWPADWQMAWPLG